MRGLNERQRKILGALEHRAREDLTLVAKELRMKVSALRYTLNGLKDRGLVRGVAPFIDPYLLGYSDYTIFFTFSNIKSKQRKEFLKYCALTNGVSWLAELGGRYSHAVSILAKNVSEAGELFYNLCSLSENIIATKSLSARTAFYAFGRKYLSKSKTKILSFGKTSNDFELDKKNRLILDFIANNDFDSIQAMSREMSIPYTTLANRISELETKGVIKGYIYRYDLSSVKINTYRLLLFGKGVDASLPEKLYEFSEKHPNIIHYVSCLGSWDFELGIESEITRDINTIVDDVYDYFPDSFNQIEVIQIFEHLKYSGYPFGLS